MFILAAQQPSPAQTTASALQVGLCMSEPKVVLSTAAQPRPQLMLCSRDIARQCCMQSSQAVPQRSPDLSQCR